MTFADEAAGTVADDPLILRHLGDEWEGSIYRVACRVLKDAEATGRTPAAVALELAETRSFETHPLFGHRGQAIIDSLIQGGWARGSGIR